jgi:hypothetical protein
VSLLWHFYATFELDAVLIFINFARLTTFYVVFSTGGGAFFGYVRL